MSFDDVIGTALNLQRPPFQLQLLQQHARRGDIAAAIESAIDSLQVSLREQQLDVWSRTAAAAEAPALSDEHVVCCVCLDRLYCPLFLSRTPDDYPSLETLRASPQPRPLRTLVCPGKVNSAFCTWSLS